MEIPGFLYVRHGQTVNKQLAADLGVWNETCGPLFVFRSTEASGRACPESRERSERVAAWIEALQSGGDAQDLLAAYERGNLQALPPELRARIMGWLVNKAIQRGATWAK